MSEKNSIQDSSNKSREYILEVTQEEYDAMKAKGIDEEAILSVGKHVFRRRSRVINPRDAKIKLTFYIEGDLLQHFRKLSGEDKENFERILNEELRRAMERDLVEEKSKLDSVAERLVNDSAFINAISEKLKAA